MFFVREKAFYKTVFSIAIPIALQNVVGTVLNMADTVMLGMVDAKTEETIAAAGYANQIYFLPVRDYAVSGRSSHTPYPPMSAQHGDHRRWQ